MRTLGLQNEKEEGEDGVSRGWGGRRKRKRGREGEAFYVVGREPPVEYKIGPQWFLCEGSLLVLM